MILLFPGGGGGKKEKEGTIFRVDSERNEPLNSKGEGKGRESACNLGYAVRKAAYIGYVP